MALHLEKEEKSHPFLTPHPQVNFQLIKDFNVNGKMLKRLEENVEYLYDLKIARKKKGKQNGNSVSMGRQADKYGYTKTRNFRDSKDTIKRMKRKATNQKTPTTRVTSEGLIHSV